MDNNSTCTPCLPFPNKILRNPIHQWPNRHPIISTIRCSQNAMNMESRRLLIRKKDSRMMIELHNDNRTLYAIVESIIVPKAANPAEISFMVPRLCSCHAQLMGLSRKVEKEF